MSIRELMERYSQLFAEAQDALDDANQRDRLVAAFHEFIRAAEADNSKLGQHLVALLEGDITRLEQARPMVDGEEGDR